MSQVCQLGQTGHLAEPGTGEKIIKDQRTGRRQEASFFLKE
jgi:hypothetical protein